MQQNVTLRDIAKAVGVSHETVSRALRNDRKISPATKTRVLELAERLGYRSNPLVQALMRTRYGMRAKKTTANVVFLKPIWEKKDYWKDPPFKEQAEWTLERLRELGFDASPLSLPAEALRSNRLDSILQAQGVCGIIVGSMPPTCRELRLNSANYAMVGVGLSLKEPKIDRVSTDVSRETEMLFEEVLSRGYERPGLALREDHVERREYLPAAIWRHLQENRLPRNQRVPPFIGKFNASKVGNWFQRHRPDAIISLETSYLDFVRDAGKSVPQDVGFAFLETNLATAEFAGVKVDVHVIGALAAELLAEKMFRNDFGIPHQRHTLLVDPLWREGNTLRQKTGCHAFDVSTRGKNDNAPVPCPPRIPPGPR